jgi:cytochrome c-type biogenesis protein CcmH
MILWFVLTVLTSIAAVFVSAPFIRRLERRQLESPRDVAVYRDQLKEVESEAALGLIEPAQAELARTEIKRRMLSAADAQDGALPPLSSGERTFAAIGVAGVVVFGSVGLFALTANLEPPSAPPFAALDAPFADKGERASAKKIEETAAASRGPGAGAAPAMRSGAAQTALPPVEEMIQKLVTRLQRNPKDVAGWKMLGWSYFSTDHYVESAAAYARAIELDPDSADARNSRVEALIRAANGVVTPEAKSATDETLKRHAKDPRARYIVALATDQAGDHVGAQKEWNELLAEVNVSDPLYQELKQKIDGSGKNGDRGAETAASAVGDKGLASAPSGEPSIGKREPRPEDIRNAEAMTPGDRASMIQRMVDSLADRLEQSPHDIDGWIKLIRSRSVLGDKEKAKLALEKALKVFAEETPERKRITTTAEELGLGR